MTTAVAAQTTVEKTPRSSFKLRALRHLAAEFCAGPLTVTAWHPRLQVIAGHCENVSLHGLCIAIPNGAERAGLLQVDDRLIGLHVTLQSGEVVANSDAIVRHLRPSGSDLLVGLQLDGGVIDLPTLYEKQSRSLFASRCDEVERHADSQRIRPPFKEWVSDLRSYLERMRGFLDREELALQSEDRYTYGELCNQYLAEVGPRMVQRVHAASHSMAGLLGDLSEEEHIAHRSYAQLHLGSLFLTAPFIRRAQQKPLGYAGDYEMMNMLYRPSHMEGPSLFARVVNQCAATETAARANINRVDYLCAKLSALLVAAQQSGSRERVRVASIGSGPAREIESLLESAPQLGPFLEVMLVDQDPRAIAFCERRLTPIAQRSGARLHFVRESVRRLLCGGMIAQTMGPRQLIYSAGLFDYLSDRSFSALLGTLYEAIPRGGQLIVGNVDVSNPTRYFMEYFAEWFLIHRSRAQLLDKARQLRPPPQAARVEAEPLGVNLFLVVER
jgi:extracellular factor (EF) 3-hydroxypalmitic acid methyl ester biosynthesis protein